jgi:prophage regulatory protein
MVINFLKLPVLKQKLGKSKSAIYLDIQEGLFPRPVPLGARAVGFPEHEADAINAARMAGMDDDEIRELVIELEAKRKTFIDKVEV